MSEINNKKRILVFIGHYYPGYKSGGILRSVTNTVIRLGDEFDFLIITRDHDIGDKTAYSKITPNEWQSVGKAKVLYLDSLSGKYKNLCKIINDTDYDLIHLNSFFDLLSIKVLLAFKFNKIKKSPIILSPRGEFAWASFKIKFLKKNIYIILSRIFRLYENIIWHASTRHEKHDIGRAMNIGNNILTAKDLVANEINKEQAINVYSNNFMPLTLRIIFLSRISPEKNLDYAIKVLSKVKINVSFDIYGMTENESYWKLCQKLIKELPNNVVVSYKGSLKPSDVVETLSRYDLFLFPSGGENYGHVIAESLSAGTPVLISKNTPWLDLEKMGVGWDIDLTDMNLFVSTIERIGLLTKKEHISKRNEIIRKASQFLSDERDYEDNRQLFLQTLV